MWQYLSLAATKTFLPNSLENLKASVTIEMRGLVIPNTLTAGFTFLLPSSWGDGPIEVRNFNRDRKVYIQAQDCVRLDPKGIFGGRG
jgi:hypothetical protein